MTTPAQAQTKARPAARPASVSNHAQSGLLLRKCACGESAGLDGECPECREKKLTAQRRAMNGNQPPPMPPDANDTEHPSRPHPDFDFSHVRVSPAVPGKIQTKLTVNEPGDKYEQEADRVAEQVMKMPVPESPIPPSRPNDTEAENHPLLRKEANGVAERGASNVPPIVNEVLNSAGQPLDDAARTFMEPRFGYDFSKVRVHTDAKALESARSINALAYTVGQKMVFGSGQYKPETNKGRMLLAHELTHVVQQSPNSVHPFMIQRKPPQASDSSSSTKPVADKEQLYNLTIGSEMLTNATATQAIQALRRHYRQIVIKTDTGEEAHEDLIKIHEDQWIVSFFSDKLGGVKMPPISIWNEPRMLLNRSLASLNAGSVEQSVRDLASAEEAYQRAYRLFYVYREGTISGADTSITVLKYTAVAGAVAATVATGGAASGAGLLTTSVAVGTVGGVYGATQETAYQTGEKIAGTRQEFDYARILRRGAKDAITNFVGSLVGGALSRYFLGSLGSYLSKIIGSKVGQRVVVDFLASVGAAPLTTAVGIMVERITGGSSIPEPADFAQMVLNDMIRAGIGGIFLSFLHSYSGKTTGPGEQSGDGGRSSSTSSAETTSSPQPGSPRLVYSSKTSSSATQAGSEGSVSANRGGVRYETEGAAALKVAPTEPVSEPAPPLKEPHLKPVPMESPEIQPAEVKPEPVALSGAVFAGKAESKKGSAQVGSKPVTKTKTAKKPKQSEDKECSGNPSADPLPIYWPQELPLPADEFGLERKVSASVTADQIEAEGLDGLEKEKRGPQQEKLRKEILAAKDEAEKAHAPELWHDFPRRCFNSGDNLYYNLQFDAHHIHPLYLGGYDVDDNLCALERDQHQRGHRRLDYQEGMGDIYRYQYGICSEYLSHHPPGQKYNIEGEK